MKYLDLDQPFAPISGRTPTFESDGVPEHDATWKDVLHLIVDSYMPMQGKILDSVKDSRKYNRVMATIEPGAEPNGKNGVYTFEDDDLALVKKLSEWMMPVLSGQGIKWFRELPRVLEFLDAARDKPFKPMKGITGKEERDQANKEADSVAVVASGDEEA